MKVSINVKSKFLAFVFSTICFMPSASQAVVVQNKCITKISEVLKEIPENLSQEGSTIAVFDWDDTIAPWDDILRQQARKFEPREPEENGTLHVIKSLQDKGIKTMILTGRLGGLRLDEKEIVDVQSNLDTNIPNMLDLVGTQQWIEHGPFKNRGIVEMKVPEALNLSREKGSKERPLYFIAKDHFVFAGGNRVKGKVLRQLIDKDLFISPPQNIIFIDNEDENTNDIAENFKDSPQKLYIYYYPGPKEKLKHKGCTDIQ